MEKQTQSQSFLKTVHPFQIEVLDKIIGSAGKITYKLGVYYHSRLYKGLSLENKSLPNQYLQYKRAGSSIAIKGLDKTQTVSPNVFPAKNYYCVLKIDVTNLVATNSEIVWVEAEDASAVNATSLGINDNADLSPVKFASATDLRQTGARIIIGVLAYDKRAIPMGSDSTQTLDQMVNTPYVIQYINTDLMMCNMVFDGIPIIYPTPFVGGRLYY